MKTKKMTNKGEKQIIINGISIGVTTAALISIFLSGKIIEIPKGTHEEGVISAIGVGVIIVFMSIVGFILNKIRKTQQQNNTK